MLNIPKSGGLTVFREGFSDLVGGMDSSRAPDLIDQHHSALGVNLTHRGGKPHTRPRFKEVDLGESEEADLVRRGLFQGGVVYYSTVLGTSLKIGIYSGWLLAIDPVAKTVQLLNPGDRNETSRKHYLIQAENFLIVQNGIDIPLIWDGDAATARRSVTGVNNPILGTSNSNITRAGSTATVTTTDPHLLTTGEYIQIDGVNVAGYVNQFYVTVTAPNEFTITVDSTLGTPTVFGVTRLCPEIPTGLMMAYGQGRIFLASSNRVELLAGDIIYGDIQGQVGNILRWTENQYLAEGISFRLSSNQGRMVALVFPTFQDTGTGQGELFAFGEYGASSFLVSEPRSAITDPISGNVVKPGWRDIQIQKIVLSQVGCTSQWSMIPFTNGDLFYRDMVGIRSYRNARGSMQSYGQTPISAEMNRILNADVKTRLANISGIHFSDRMFMTCTPLFEFRQFQILDISESGVVTLSDDHQFVDEQTITIGGTEVLDGDYVISDVTATTFKITISAGADRTLKTGSYVTGENAGAEIYHKGLAVLDFNSTSTVGGKSSPAWDGVWTGLNFQQLGSGFFNGQEKAYSFVYGGPGQNQIWEITEEVGEDLPAGIARTTIAGVLETRSYDFGMQFNKKKLRRLDIWLSDLTGDVEMKVFYKMDGASCWIPWNPSWKRCATISTVLIGETNKNVDGLLQNRPQIRTQITQPTPPAGCDKINGGQSRMGFEVQIRLEFTGIVTIEKLVITADDVVESPLARCPAGATEEPEP